MEELCQEADYHSRGPSLSGVGPSQDTPSAHRALPGPLQPQHGLPRPSSPSKEAQKAPEPTPLEIMVTVCAPLFIWADRQSVKYPGVASILLLAHNVNAAFKTTAMVYWVPLPILHPDAANSYLKMTNQSITMKTKTPGDSRETPGPQAGPSSRA